MSAFTADRRTALAMAIPTDAFLEALDRQTIPIGGATWSLEGYAIIVEAQRRWIQAEAVGPARVPLRINVSVETSPGQVLAAVASYLESHNTTDADGLAGATLVIDA